MSEWDPDSHRQVNTLQQLVAEFALADLVLEGDERVLDVGCGDENVAPFSPSKPLASKSGERVRILHARFRLPRLP